MDTNHNNIILDTEHLFKIKLLNEVGENWLMIKSQHNCCVVDFVMVNKMNVKTIHLEHKKRSGYKCNYDTLFMGFDKINKVDKYYKKCIYVWEYDNELYWIKHKKSLLKCNTGFIMGGKVYHINKSECKVGFDTLLTYINNLSNDRY